MLTRKRPPMLFRYGYNARDHINQLPEEFRKEDNLRDEFAKVFKDVILPILKEGNNHLMLPIDINNLTRNYAFLVISAIRSSVEKEDTSPLFRINDEIAALESFNKKYQHIIDNNRSKKVFNKVLSLANEKFPQVAELSEETQHLLRVNLEWHHITYMSAFHPSPDKAT